ncbi:mechanosensitive ion channel family protein [Clostridium sp. SHJSY1]|uniref:mechanosensitive ion channel family protein n=1 Tax=Clostridium sp. SHJSY1 TaxID=2942483 RepID=UPI002876F424|nr:mechanosensitive ion channel family protein [Clostridium sp. SHJSY1]MDS0527919.1 mechanosensitive ion channel family protein [Clostridium sp. SHJSY1]
MQISLNWEDGTINIWGIPFTIQQVENVALRVLRIIIILILMCLVIKIGKRIINKFVDQQIKSNARFSMDNQKARTIGGVMKSILRYTTYFIGISIIATDFFGGMPVAVASVGGVALGFGAQSLVKDVINGLFILFEDQYGVGDHITIGNFSGIVETIGIRTTSIRDFSGGIHLIPNGSIVQITNHSKGNSKFTVDIEVAYEEDTDEIISIISKVAKKFEEENEDVVAPVEVLGINSMSLSKANLIIRVSGSCKPLKQGGMERKLRKNIKDSLDEYGIKVPSSKVE